MNARNRLSSIVSYRHACLGVLAFVILVLASSQLACNTCGPLQKLGPMIKACLKIREKQWNEHYKKSLRH